MGEVADLHQPNETQEHQCYMMPGYPISRQTCMKNPCASRLGCRASIRVCLQAGSHKIAEAADGLPAGGALKLLPPMWLTCPDAAQMAAWRGACSCRAREPGPAAAGAADVPEPCVDEGWELPRAADRWCSNASVRPRLMLGRCSSSADCRQGTAGWSQSGSIALQLPL
jgi:hypothetical protein